MAVDLPTVRRVAHLARIRVTEEEAARLQGELNAILGFVEQLSEVDVAGVEPMTAVGAARLKQRDDVVDDGRHPDLVLSNAPEKDDGFFLVPKVVE